MGRSVDSPKPLADLIIDDTALGIPLITGDGEPYVDWHLTEFLLKEKGYL